MLSDSLIALIRTAVPLAVGWVVTQLALIGVTLPADTELQLATALTAVCAAAYWALVTWASKRVPALGWLLGVAATPSYSTPADAPMPEPLDGETREAYRARIDG